MKNKDLVNSLLEILENPEHSSNREIVAIGRFVYPGMVDEAEKLLDFLEINGSIADLVEHLEENPPGAMVIAMLGLIAVGRYKSKAASRAANTLHDMPGGSREKSERIQVIWRSGKYGSKDVCAEQECAALNMSFSSARKALRNI